MAKHKWHRVDFFGKAARNIVVEDEKGNQRSLETNKGRFERMRDEVKSGRGTRKRGENVELTKEEIAYNKGFLRAYRDNAKIAKRKNNQ